MNEYNPQGVETTGSDVSSDSERFTNETFARAIDEMAARALTDGVNPDEIAEILQNAAKALVNDD